jgi:hypothetical protein
VIEVRLVKPLKGITVRFDAEVVCRDAAGVVVRAPWGGGVVDLGLLRFEPGDVLIESYYAERWYNVFELHDAEGRLKGWYCNITRPAVIRADSVESEDLELDLLVSADRRTQRLDDEDEFAARNLERDDPAAHRAALAAVEELRALATRGAPPFNTAPATGAPR